MEAKDWKECLECAYCGSEEVLDRSHCSRAKGDGMHQWMCARCVCHDCNQETLYSYGRLVSFSGVFQY